jgi:two-component system, NtrC family, sensor histidine kinase HydH
MKLYPSWKSNLALFVILIILVAGYFFLQLQKASNQFAKHSREHSEVVAGVVELNIRSTISSSSSLETIYKGFLKNSAHFLHYLESIEPFTESELTAFSAEAGLSGVRILRSHGETVAGPADWLSDTGCFPPEHIVYDEKRQIYLLSYFPDGWVDEAPNEQCIIVGVAAEGFEQMREDVSLEKLLAVLNKLPGIAYVRFKEASDGSGQDDDVSYQDLSEGKAVSRHIISLGGRELIVALEAEHFQKRMTQMRKELALFILFLMSIGCFSSWWLYRSQRLRLQETRKFERQMARQHEEAALGRAASTITHELRNPLNAIGIGLQRLQFEADSLTDEQRHLLSSMREAVKRSNNVITSLRQYIHDFQVEETTINISEFIGQLVAPYHNRLEKQNIVLSLSLEKTASVRGDRELLGQLFENLLRNSMEAQPDGGYLRVEMAHDQKCWRITFSNGGLSITETEAQQLFQPYFTTKAKGTGLGLTISRKIVEAHKGTIGWTGDFEKKELSVWVVLPESAESVG